MPKYIDADLLAALESEAYLNVQSREDDKLKRDLNQIIHMKLLALLAQADSADAASVTHA